MGRAAAGMLRGFAFAMAPAVGGAIAFAPQLADALGRGSWLASLLPDDPYRIALWVAIASLNAGGAFVLASWLED